MKAHVPEPENEPAAAPFGQAPAAFINSPESVLAGLSGLGGNAATRRLANLMVQREPQAPGTPNVKIATTEQDVTIETYRVAIDPAVQRRDMESLIAEKSNDAPREFYDTVRLALDRQTPLAGVPDNQGDLEKARKTVESLRQVVEQLEKDIEKLVADFATEGRTVLGEILTESETRTKAEGIRYGLTANEVEEWVNDPEGGRVHKEFRTSYTIDNDSSQTKSLAEAGRQLLARRTEIQPLQTKVNELTLQWNFAKPPIPKPAALQQAEDELRVAELKYDALVAELTGTFPVLGAFTKDKTDLTALQRLAAGPSQEVAQFIGTQIAQRMTDISRVREQNKPDGDVNIYKLPKVIALTKGRKAMQPGAWQDAVIDRYAADVKSAAEIMNIALGLINLAMVLLAPVTGGVTLVAAAGISTAVAVAHAQEYMLEDAMAGTDLDKAKALSQTEPSLFWLAVDIVAAIADVGAAAGAAGKLLSGFRRLAPMVNELKAAKTAEEAAELTRALDQAATDVGGTKLASRIGKSIETEGVLKGASKEVAAVEAAGKAAVEAELKAGVEVATNSGHVHVTKRGKLFSCHSPCLEMRARHAEILAADSKLMDRLVELENKALALGENASPAEMKALGKSVAELDDVIVKATMKVRAERIAAWLPTLAERYPILAKYPLDAEAIARVLEKGALQNMKGQLLEELMAAQIKRMLGDPAGREALAGAAKANENLEFIPGHLIRQGKKQFTDGMIIIRRGEAIEVVTIFEAKAGAASSRGLRSARESLPELAAKSLQDLEASKAAATTKTEIEAIEEAQTLRKEAIEQLRETNPKKIPDLDSMPSSKIDELYKADVDKVMNKLPKTEAGQARHDIERLGAGNVEFLDDTGTWKQARIGSKAGSTKVMGVLPEGVSGEAMTKEIVGERATATQAAKGQLIDFGTTNAEINAKDLEALATDIATRASGTQL